MATVEEVKEFIDAAERNRKYPPATAQGLRAAIKLFNAELNEDERSSIDKLESNLEQIYQTVYSKNKVNFTAASLATYRARLTKVINDYKKYGADPTKLANWNPKVLIRSPRRSQSKPTEEASSGQPTRPTAAQTAPPTNMHNIELALRPDVKFVIVMPRDLRQAEADILVQVINSLPVDKIVSDSQQPTGEGGNAGSGRG